jgi:hypothetical protein
MQPTKNGNGPPFPAMAGSDGMAVTTGGGLCLQPKPQIRETLKNLNLEIYLLHQSKHGTRIKNNNTGENHDL